MLSKLTHIFMESTKEKALLCQLWLPTCLHHSLVGPWGLGALCATYHGFSSCFFFLWGLSSGKTSGCFLKNSVDNFFFVRVHNYSTRTYVFNNFISWKLIMCYGIGLPRPIPPRSAVRILVPPKEKGWESAWIRQQNKLHIGWKPTGMALPE